MILPMLRFHRLSSSHWQVTPVAIALASSTLFFGCGGGGSNGPLSSQASAPAITTQPSDLTVADGQSATFSVTASGPSSLIYQWSRNGVPIAGATASSYTLATAYPSDSKSQFMVKVSNANGSVASNSATLVVSYTNSSSTTGALGIPRSSQISVLLPSGRVLVAGGHTVDPTTKNTITTSTAEIYDPDSQTFTATGSMNIARADASATLLPSGRVLIVGGSDNQGYALSSSELYNPTTGTFTSSGLMNIPRWGASSTLLSSGKILVAGGYNNTTSTNSGNQASAELYDPTTGIFSFTGSMGTARISPSATLLGSGKVLIAGGHQLSTSNPVETNLASAELYDPASATFTPTSNMATARDGHTATLLPDGTVLLAGGESNTAVLAFAELYDPTSGAFTSTSGSMNSPRYWHTASMLLDGKVLIAGGQDNGGVILTSTELYDPSKKTFTNSGPLTAPRKQHTATVLLTGHVLMVGGNNYQTNYFSTVDIYK